MCVLWLSILFNANWQKCALWNPAIVAPSWLRNLIEVFEKIIYEIKSVVTCRATFHWICAVSRVIHKIVNNASIFVRMPSNQQQYSYRFPFGSIEFRSRCKSNYQCRSHQMHEERCLHRNLVSFITMTQMAQQNV